MQNACLYFLQTHTHKKNISTHAKCQFLYKIGELWRIMDLYVRLRLFDLLVPGSADQSRMVPTEKKKFPP